jgi:hypothetical protein
MTDALATYEPKNDGVWLKFRDGDEIKLRVLTLDPLITEKIWDNSPDKIDTKYAFTVWNWNENRAQVLRVGAGLLKRFTKIHRDEDYEPLNKVDIKITATGEQLERRYEVDVLQKVQPITQAILDESRMIELEKLLPDNRGRLSQYQQEDEESTTSTTNHPQTGLEKAREQASNLRKVDKVFDVESDDLGNQDDFLL